MERPDFENLFAIMFEKAQEEAQIWLEGDKIASRSWGELKARALSCAAQIKKLGVGAPGEWVGISVDTCPEWPMIFWGLISTGRNVIMLDAAMDDEKTAHLMQQSGAKTIICRRDRKLEYNMVKPDAILAACEPEKELQWGKYVAFCTSGTTSTSRVYAYDAKALCANIAAISRRQTEFNELTRESRGPLRTLCFLPLHHIFGFMTNLMWTSFMGYPQVFLKDRAPETIKGTCQKTGVQFILTVPLLVNTVASGIDATLKAGGAKLKIAFAVMKWMSLTMQRISPMAGLKLGKKLFGSVLDKIFGRDLELVVVGGSHMPLETLKTINALGYHTVEGYGMTEIGVPSANAMMNLRDRLAGACGIPFETSEYKVKPTGKDPNVGELLVKTSTMHVAQLKDGKMVPAEVDKDGYYATGDIGRLTKDGNLFIEGRFKDVIVDETGENIYPDELEDVFSAMQGVEQFSVLGTQLSGEYEMPTLVLNVGAKMQDEAYLKELASEVSKRNRKLESSKRIRKVLAIEEKMPLSGSMKIKRYALRASLEEHKIAYRELSSEGVGAQVEAAAEQEVTLRQNQEIHDKVVAILAETLGKEISEIGDHAHIMDDLGGNSLQAISLSLKAEEEFGIQIPEDQYTRCATVAGMTDLICELKGL